MHKNYEKPDIFIFFPKNKKTNLFSQEFCRITLTGMGLPAILALAISELVRRGTLLLAIPPSSSELDKWLCSGAAACSGPRRWPWLCRTGMCCLKLTLYLGNQYILYRRQRVTYTVLEAGRATNSLFVPLRRRTQAPGKETNSKQKQKEQTEKCKHTVSNNADNALFM